jgi:diaminopropionate ammonia-lyase
MQYCLRKRGEHGRADTSFVSREEAQRARAFHATLPGYAPTPLVRLDALAGQLGVGAVWLKDESKRFGLNAFKALGGSWAIANGEFERSLLGIVIDRDTVQVSLTCDVYGNLS